MSIDEDRFMEAWHHLERRFGRTPDAGQAAAYYDFLDGQIDTDTFLVSARTLWATAKWFPRPADFLLLAASGEWSNLLKAAEHYVRPYDEWQDHWNRLSPRAKKACTKIGDMGGIRQIYEKDVLRLKKAFEEAYEQSVADEVIKLPPPSTRALKSA